MNKLNPVEFAIKVTSFRKKIREICTKKGLEYPSDSKISEYINDCGGLDCVFDINDFMSDYETKDGVFRDPFIDFKAEIDKYAWAEKPTEEEMREFITEHGYDVRGFLRQHTINKYNPLEREVLIATLTNLKPCQMAQLWNKFIEESAMYGADSYIYDINEINDLNMLRKNMTPSMWASVVALKARYVQWFNLNDGKIQKVDEEDIKGSIIAYWSDIFPRLLAWGECYEKICTGTKDEMHYFDFIVRPIFCKYLGYNYDPSRGTIEEIKKA
jgi:hypothetical protein